MGRLTCLPLRLSAIPASRVSTVNEAPSLAYKHWYWTERWRKLSRQQLREHPLCTFCHQHGQVTAARVCDHIEPHRGNEDAFWRGPFQSLCKGCHDGAKKRMENARGQA